MAFHKSAFLLLSLVFLSLFHVPVSADKKSYIVYLGVHNHGLVDPDQITSTHHDLLGSILGSREKAEDSIFYSYTSNINGFAAKLEEDEAARIAQHPSVVSIFLDKSANLHTSHSWETMHLEKNGVPLPHSLWRKANYGEDVIIANLDTGVWPESESFSDEGFGPVPSRWKGGCQNNTKEGVLCNNKLIGAKVYKTFYEQAGNSLTSRNYSARDHEGHGTHTLSTAGGNFVSGVDYFGVAIGTIKGGSPKARVAAYKICFPKTETGGGCYYGDGLTAFVDATNDGVDVISFSVGGTPDDYVNDGFALGAFEAVKKGVVVVCSAGNAGPNPGTVTNVAPWILTVAASTIDREYANKVVLQNGKHIKGASLAKNDLPKGKFYPLINSEQAKAVNATAEDAMICLPGTLDPAKVKGKIVACLRGKNARVLKGIVAKSAGAVGMILCNDESTGTDVVSDHHALPTTHINYKHGQAVYSYINSTTEPQAYITAAKRHLGVKPSPTMIGFSSAGPNTITPGILKPDITAPGVNIIASFMNAEDPIERPLGKTPYEFMSGTSMSCPHVAGVAGLLKAIHRDWSPAAIKSAILTTAITRSNVMRPIMSAASQVQATPFNYGHGHIRPNSAADPGLVYDLTETDYLDFLCASGYNKTMMQSFTNMTYECPENFHIKDFNYPSITLTNVTSEGVTATRKVKNVGMPGTYAVKIQQPAGFSVSVEPSILKFERIGEEKSFKVSFKVLSDAGQDFVFGGMTWTDGTHYVRSPLVVSASA